MVVSGRDAETEAGRFAAQRVDLTAEGLKETCGGTSSVFVKFFTGKITCVPHCGSNKTKQKIKP